MGQRIQLMGIREHEAAAVRRLLALLRSPDPVAPELTMAALAYVEQRTSAAAEGTAPPSFR